MNDKKLTIKTDRFLLLVTTILTVVGLIMMFSAGFSHALYLKGDGFYYIKRQAIFAVMGFIAMLIISHISYRIYHHFAWIFFLISYILLAATLAMPPINNARRWIIIGGFTFQPSEMIKFTIVLLFAHLISVAPEKMDSFNLGFLRFLIILGMVFFITLLQPHLSGTILIFAIGMAVLFIAGVKIRYFFAGAAMSLPILALIVLTSDKYRYALERILTNTQGGDTADEAYQVNQGLIAIGSGGLFGLGLGNSRQKQLYVPEPQNDFVFSIICEELGFIGAFIIVIIFVLFIVRGAQISMRAPDKFGSLIAAGITAQVAIQVILNIAVVTALVPNTGIGLPFFSQGGTALFLLLCEVGVLLNVSRESERVEIMGDEEEETETDPFDDLIHRED
ncbi:MAG: putative peptidoglycan glycosyltransferase FtsW [Oscillospiraceae bacterium]|nr:putative peptidoglycan glycosyltransferase FtsW [Oscillospiraceae bacterium]